MFPDNPNISNITDFVPYVKFDRNLPELPQGVTSLSIGPKGLSVTSEGLAYQYWYARAEGSSVYVAYANPTGPVKWEAEELLFTARGDITEMGLTFLQNANPLVFFKTNTDQLYLYWYDTVLGSYSIRDLTKGGNPICGFDYVTEPENPNSDAMVFYAKDEYTLAMRVQRDRWDVEYLFDIGHRINRVVDCGMTVQWRFQVRVEWLDEEKSKNRGWLPEDPATGEWIEET